MMSFVWHWLLQKVSKLKNKFLGVPEPDIKPLDLWSSQSPFPAWAAYSKVCLAVSVLLFVAFTFLYFERKIPQPNALTTRKRRADTAVFSNTSVCHVLLHTWLEGFMLFLILCIILTVPWEWVRLYQIEVARKMAVLSEGLPYKCNAEEFAFWDAVKDWFSWHFAWNTDVCENYHRALVVDPFWEVTPLMAVSSAVGRIIIHPMEQLSQVTGKSLRNVMKEIPSQWQPLVFLMIPLCLVMLVTGLFFKSRAVIMATVKHTDQNSFDKASCISQRKSRALRIYKNT
ncbi:chloride channel CLIC-like protein 1 [Protopterus annectens]|uniref:chloride channel CLIC-like protein 1 n=1 Tax=Protopterus annectens TaxID=7888 RepID=UPI001CFC07DE|nr:chloride channel CLIC-like protein 1 [Protopterus annectens]